MTQFPVHHCAVATLAVKVLLPSKLGQVQQRLPALDVAVVGADAHGARVEVDVAIEVEQAVAEYKVDGEGVGRGGRGVGGGGRGVVEF